MSEKDALNLVEQLISNEKKDKAPVQKKVYKTKTEDVSGNPGYKEEPQEYWPGDKLTLSKGMLVRTRLNEDAFFILINTPTANREACVYCPWYSIYGWGANTREAMDNCVLNINEYWDRHTDKATALRDSFKGYIPKKKPLKNLRREKKDTDNPGSPARQKDKTAADILMDEGL